MFCPECGGEFREGIVECPDCEVVLVARLPEEQHPERNWVAVFETGDVSLLPVVKSLLTAAEIPFMVQGDEAVGMLPVSRLGTGISMAGQGLSATVHVDGERVEEARRLLDDLRRQAEERSESGKEE